MKRWHWLIATLALTSTLVPSDALAQGCPSGYQKVGEHDSTTSDGRPVVTSLCAPISTPAAHATPTLSSADVAQLAADRAKLALMSGHRAKLKHVLDLLAREAGTQSENARDSDRLQRAVTQDLVSDSLGALTSGLFMDPLQQRLGLSDEAVESVKETLDAAREAADTYALSDSLGDYAESPHDEDVQDRRREKLIDVIGSLAGHVLALPMPAELQGDVKTFVGVETEALKASHPMLAGSTTDRIATALDSLAGMVGAVNPEIGGLRNLVNAGGGAYVLYVVHGDAQSIHDAQVSVARAQTSLAFKLALLDAQQAALQQKIQRETSPAP